ncbi:MAG: hypothetical protein EA374_06910 [Acholeplasmatales bacterium]|nr:MAG: hypothetical protein EA374_06910 [Acholeplasmatales bacterium]
MRILILSILLVMTMALSGCGVIREWIKQAPDEVVIPKDALQATCEKGDAVHTFIYKGDGVYMILIDGVRQADAVLHAIQEETYWHNQSVHNYLIATFGEDGCTIEPYGP